MSLESLKANQLDRSELLAIKGGLAPDCEQGLVPVYIPGIGYQCVPDSACEWVLLSGEDPINSDLPPPEGEGTT